MAGGAGGWGGGTEARGAVGGFGGPQLLCASFRCSRPVVGAPCAPRPGDPGFSPNADNSAQTQEHIAGGDGTGGGGFVPPRCPPSSSSPPPCPKSPRGFGVFGQLPPRGGVFRLGERVPHGWGTGAKQGPQTYGGALDRGRGVGREPGGGVREGGLGLIPRGWLGFGRVSAPLSPPNPAPSSLGGPPGPSEASLPPRKRQR